MDARGASDTRGRAWSAESGRRRDVQLSADLAGESEVDLAVSWDNRAGTVRAGQRVWFPPSSICRQP